MFGFFTCCFKGSQEILEENIPLVSKYSYAIVCYKNKNEMPNFDNNVYDDVLKSLKNAERLSKKEYNDKAWEAGEYIVYQVKGKSLLENLSNLSGNIMIKHIADEFGTDKEKEIQVSIDAEGKIITKKKSEAQYIPTSEDVNYSNTYIEDRTHVETQHSLNNNQNLLKIADNKKHFCFYLKFAIVRTLGKQHLSVLQMEVSGILGYLT